MFFNYKFLRLLSTNYLGKPQYQAIFDSQETRLTRPLLRISIANMALVYLLVAVADVTALK
jgi:hypothetical protein